MDNLGVVVQWLEHRPVTAEVAGSSPVSPVKLFTTRPYTYRTPFIESFELGIYCYLCYRLLCGFYRISLQKTFLNSNTSP